MTDISLEIMRLVEYAIRKDLIEESDRIYCTNAVLEVLGEDYFEGNSVSEITGESVEDILNRIRLWAVENGKVENDSNELLDLLDTRIMGVFVSKPSEFIRCFMMKYKESPETATQFYYEFAKNTNYIREQRVAKDIKWTYATPYVPLHMTINLSKPERDPRAIAKAKDTKDVKYPKCLLCKENEGYAGRVDHPARQNHRVIPITLGGEDWFMQYSPYVYYNEHCIVFKGEHVPMKITSRTILRLLEFVEKFPHYMIGSNADLPIVGGSILTHDHFQGGNYEFAMAKARESGEVTIGNRGLTACTLHWPMSVIRLKGENIPDLVEASSHIIGAWKGYSDEKVEILSHSGAEEHNTITPIARFRKGLYEVDLILRNNRKSGKYPFGIFHSHEEYHHIKWENIGLIECMGLAVLPSRLKKEMLGMKGFILKNDLDGIYGDEALKKHGDFAKVIMESHPELDEGNIDKIIDEEIGEVFFRVLLNCGVFKDDEIGNESFARCREALYADIR